MIRVDVCICTYKRESLTDTLASLAGQKVDDVDLSVIVADNDQHSGRREGIQAIGRQLGLNLHYVHAPSRNISVARNACLDAATGDWIAFIDDDEVAAPNWLAELLRASKDHDVVFGAVQAIYGDDAPRWIVRGDFNSTRLAETDARWNGHTGNVLLNRVSRKTIEARFLEDSGQTGGEDTLFFYELMQAGARFSFSPKAVVTEQTDKSRASLRWLLLRRFRSGQTHAIILRRQGRILQGSMAAVAKFGWSMGLVTCSLPMPHVAARHLMRGALHAGVIAAATGLATYREYGAPDAGKRVRSPVRGPQ